MTVLLESMPAAAGRPATAVRQAGDQQLQIEYGSMKADLRLNFRVQAFVQATADDPIAGVTEIAPGFRTALVTFDRGVDRDGVVAAIVERELQVPPLDSIVLRSRRIRLPIAFDDEMTRVAIQRYRITTRSDAPNVRDCENVDYIVDYNGFTNREEFYARFLSTTWWNAMMGYFPGLPSLFALDPLAQISVPKYNPARMWTAEGAVGIGGPCVVLYPIEAPGSYQLFGRTLPLWDYHYRNESHRSGRPDQSSREAARDANLFRVGDQVQFTRVTEKELLEQRLAVFDGTYAFDVEPTQFAVADYLQLLDELDDQITRVAADRLAAAAKVAVP